MSTPKAADDAYRDELAAYSLGALDSVEAEAVEVHLATCASCRGELRSLRGVTVALAADSMLVTPPEGHQGRFMQKLAANVPVVEPLGHRERFLHKLEAHSSEGDSPASPQVAVPAPRRPWWQALNPFAGWGTAGALAFGLLLALWWGAAGRTDLSRQVTTAQATAQAAQAQVVAGAATSTAVVSAAQATAQAAQQQVVAGAATSTAVVAEQARVIAILGNPATKSAQLAGKLSAQVRVWVDPVSGQTLLRATNLPTAPSGQQYELWLLRGKTPVAVDLFQPGANGQSEVSFPLPAGPPSDYTAAALTLEAQRVEQPTSTPIMTGQF
ncbi:MAG: anti-sigma factor [Chloroflexota bacterium]|nr:anti-sigma factor [Chloroflexota bacterium]